MLFINLFVFMKWLQNGKINTRNSNLTVHLKKNWHQFLQRDGFLTVCIIFEISLSLCAKKNRYFYLYLYPWCIICSVERWKLADVNSFYVCSMLQKFFITRAKKGQNHQKKFFPRKLLPKCKNLNCFIHFILWDVTRVLLFPSKKRIPLNFAMILYIYFIQLLAWIFASWWILIYLIVCQNHGFS